MHAHGIIIVKYTFSGGRHGGLVVSTLDSGLGGPGSSPGRVIVLCSQLGKTLYSHSANHLSGKPDEMSDSPAMD